VPRPRCLQEIKEQRHIDISASERLDMLRSYCAAGLEHWGSDARGVETTRKFLLEFLSYLHRWGCPCGACLRVCRFLLANYCSSS